MGVEDSKIVQDRGIENLQRSDILNIEFKKDSYYESQVVEGTVILEPKQSLVMNDILIRFKTAEYFLYKEDEKNIISEVNGQVFFEKRLNAGAFLNMGNQMISLNPGSYKFPFQFTLPKNIPPSFEFPFHNRRASLRYIFSAEVLSPYVKSTCEKYVFIKARPIIIPSDVKHENFVKVKNVGILSRGSSGVALFTLANNFRMNDSLPFTVDIYNEDCGVAVKEIKISIKRIVTFIKQGKEYPKRTAILRKRYPSYCEKNSKNSYHYEDIQIRDNELKGVEFDQNLNPYPLVQDLNMLMPNIKTNLIKCEYSLKVTSYFDMSVLGKDRPRVELPIYITHQLQRDYEYEKSQNPQGQAQSGFGQGQGGFGQSGFGQSQFGQPQGGFGQSQGGFGQSQGGFGQSQCGLGQGQGGFGQSQGGFAQNNSLSQNSKNDQKDFVNKSTQFSYEAYLAKKKISDSSNSNSKQKNQSENNSYNNLNNSGGYNQYGNNNNNNYNNNPTNPFQQNSYGGNNNQYCQSPYGGGFSGNNGSANPFGGGNNDFPSLDSLNNNKPTNPFGDQGNNNYGNPSNPFGDNGNNSNPQNPFGNNNNNSNPQNPFGNNGGYGNTNPYGGGYPGF